MSGGFRPIRHLNGGSGGCFKTQRFKKVVDGKYSNIFPGDPVVLNGAGQIERPSDVSGASVIGERNVIGIAARSLQDRQGKPKTFEASGKSLFSTSASTDWWDVYVDPGIVYEVPLQADTSAGQTDIGRMAVATASGTRISAAGQSAYQVQTSAAATANAAFIRIVGISPRALTPTNDKGSSDGLVEVVLLTNMWGGSFGGGQSV